jgi:hypothetical protein
MTYLCTGAHCWIGNGHRRGTDSGAGSVGRMGLGTGRFRAGRTRGRSYSKFCLRLPRLLRIRLSGLWAKDLERIFSRQREAVVAAIRFANDSGKEGNPAVVLFQKSKTKFEKIWTYGESPYPPARSDLPMMMLGTAEPAKLAEPLG